MTPQPVPPPLPPLSGLIGLKLHQPAYVKIVFKKTCKEFETNTNI